MAINLSWNIAQLDTVPEHNGFTDVVTTVHYRINAEDDTDGLTASAYGTASVPLPEAGDPNFVPFANLTRQIVRDWILDDIKDPDTSIPDFVETLKTRFAQKIEQDRNPPVVSKRPPWAAQ